MPVLINSEYVVVAIINRKKINWRYEYKFPKKTLLGKWFSSAPGYYFTYTIGSPELCSIEEIESDCQYVDDEIKKVYFRPHIEFNMSDESTYRKYFKTELELDNFINNDPNFKSIKFIEI